MLSDWLRDATPINTKLDNLSNMEALQIGSAINMALLDRPDSASAIYQWIGDHPALIEFSERHSFFTAMVVAIGRRKLLTVPWAMKFRVTVGAFLR